MPSQTYAADGTALVNPIWVKQEDLNLVKLSSLPKGFIELDSKAGLVKVIQTASKNPVYMKLGKLLNQQGLEEKQVRESSQLLTEMKVVYNLEVKFAYSEEEILRVYNEGPQSCMKGCDSVRLYSNDYTAVAYLESKGKIIARTVVCKNEEIGLSYVDAYGFGEPLITMLEDLGYISGDLEGCRFPLEYNSYGEILCPYLDGEKGIEIDGDEIEITSGGDYQASCTNGTLVQHTCDECSCTVTEHEQHYSEHTEQNLCESCYDDCHVHVNGGFYHVESDSIQQLENDEYVLSEEAEYLEYRNEWHASEDCVWNSYDEVYLLRDDLDL